MTMRIFKGKRAVEWEFSQLSTLILVILTLVALLILYLVLSGKGSEILSSIKDFMRFSG